ncbi:hypothetical protein P3L10_029593 [Capsicum annuum]
MALLLLVFLSLISTATSEGVFLPLERRFNTDEVEMRELRARDRIRHGRMLQQQSGVIDFPLQGSSISRIYYTRIRLGSPPKEFHVQIDTGSDVLWVSCISCKGCPTLGGIDQRSLMEDQMLKYVAKSIHGVQESISSDLSEIRILVQELAGQVISSGAQNLVPDMSGGPALAPRTLRHKPSRVELDHFHGVNPEAWIFKAERYFELNGIADTHKLSIASIYLDGDALKWFQWLNRNGQFIDWKHFIEKLIIHFQNRYGCATQSTAKIFRSDFASTLDDKNAYHMFDKLAVKCAIIDSLASFTGNDTEIETPNDMETPLIGNVELVQIDLVYGPSSIVEDAVFDEISHTIVTSDIHDLNTIFHEGAHFVTTAAKVYDTEELDIGVLTDAMTSSLNRAQPKELIEHALPVTCLFRSLIFALENRWMEFLPSSQLDQCWGYDSGN